MPQRAPSLTTTRIVLSEGYLDKQTRCGAWRRGFFRLYHDGMLAKFAQEPHVKTHATLPRSGHDADNDICHSQVDGGGGGNCGGGNKNSVLQVQLSRRSLHAFAPAHLTPVVVACANASPDRCGFIPDKQYGCVEGGGQPCGGARFKVDCRSRSGARLRALTLRAPCKQSALHWCFAFDNRWSSSGRDGSVGGVDGGDGGSSALSAQLAALTPARVQMTLIRRAFGALVRQVSQRSQRALGGLSRALAALLRRRAGR